VLTDFPSVKVPLNVLLQLIPRQQPRSYSISSSALLHPGRVWLSLCIWLANEPPSSDVQHWSRCLPQMHLTVAIVDFLTPYKRRRTGICSSFFASIDPEKEPKQVVMWIKRGLFELPTLDQDMVLISPGTGLAGMRAILQERKFLRSQRRTTDDGEQTTDGATHLYFGCRHEKKVNLMTVLWHPR
jgi:sulfite reductase alpha subunit-like flavoprotein